MYSIMKIHLGRGAICPAGAAPPDEQSLPFSFFRKGGLALAKRTAGKPRVMEVDIHGMTEEQAKKRLETLVGCLRQGRLANKIRVIGAQAGLHFLLQVQNGMTERELIDKARLRGVKIAGLSSYCFPPLTPSESTLIMGYAHFTSQQIREAAALLEQVWSN